MYTTFKLYILVRTVRILYNNTVYAMHRLKYIFSCGLILAVMRHKMHMLYKSSCRLSLLDTLNF